MAQSLKSAPERGGGPSEGWWRGRLKQEEGLKSTSSVFNRPLHRLEAVPLPVPGRIYQRKLIQPIALVLTPFPFRLALFGKGARPFLGIFAVIRRFMRRPCGLQCISAAHFGRQHHGGTGGGD